jgi:inorganic pyrophosphatase
MNLWHEVNPGTKDQINSIVEIGRGSKNKYEIDKKTGLIALDRAMYTAQDYPFDYGFVPQTLWDDDDALDVIILTTYPLMPGILVRVRPVAFMNMIDDGDADDKIIAVPCDDPRFEDIKDLADLNKHTLRELEHFFSTYKKLQRKEVKILGFKDRSEAEVAFQRGIELYREKFGTSNKTDNRL